MTRPVAPTSTLADLVIEAPARATVFEYAGIDYCCAGVRTASDTPAHRRVGRNGPRRSSRAPSRSRRAPLCSPGAPGRPRAAPHEGRACPLPCTSGGRHRDRAGPPPVRQCAQPGGHADAGARHDGGDAQRSPGPSRRAPAPRRRMRVLHNAVSSARGADRRHSSARLQGEPPPPSLPSWSASRASARPTEREPTTPPVHGHTGQAVVVGPHGPSRPGRDVDQRVLRKTVLVAVDHEPAGTMEDHEENVDLTVHVLGDRLTRVQPDDVDIQVRRFGRGPVHPIAAGSGNDRSKVHHGRTSGWMRTHVNRRPSQDASGVGSNRVGDHGRRARRRQLARRSALRVLSRDQGGLHTPCPGQRPPSTRTGTS